MIDPKERAKSLFGFTASEVRKCKIACVSKIRMITWEIDRETGSCTIYDIMEIYTKGPSHNDVRNALKRLERWTKRSEFDEWRPSLFEFPGQSMSEFYDQCPRLMALIQGAHRKWQST